MKFCDALTKLVSTHQCIHMFRPNGGIEVWLGETNTGVLRKATLEIPGKSPLSEADLNAEDWDLSQVPF